MKTTTRRGLRRLTILAATLAALTPAAALTLDTLAAPPPAAPWALVAAVILAFAGLAAAAAWALLRAVAWVIDGFTPRRATYPEPGKN